MEHVDNAITASLIIPKKSLRTSAVFSPTKCKPQWRTKFGASLSLHL